jgi:cyclopropane-fatty-acyl-phospholipid synthase
MHETNPVQHTMMSPPRGFRSLRDDMFLRIAQAWTARVATGRLRLTLPSGRSAMLGTGGGAEAAIRLKNYRLLWNGMRRGSIGVGESYMAQDFDSPDLVNVFRFFIDNKAALTRSSRGLFRVRRSDKIFHRARSNTRAGSRRNISEHYDLGNAFYAQWLDPGMTYSSALFREPSQSLDDAQREKYARILAALELKPGMRVLEIGCGWGAMAEAIANVGAHVTAITVSAEQLAYTQRRIAAAGLETRCDARFCDYRDITGTYDRIVSIEMIEAVGEEHWQNYFQTLHARLAPGGHAVIQAITIQEQAFEAYRRKADFIQRYVFPGGMLPTKSRIVSEGRAASLLASTLVSFGQGYAQTVREWRHRFDAAWPEIARLGFDARFQRMWRYYLMYCEAGFERGAVDVGLYRLEKPASPESRNSGEHRGH